MGEWEHPLRDVMGEWEHPLRNVMGEWEHPLRRDKNRRIDLQATDYKLFRKHIPK